MKSIFSGATVITPHTPSDAVSLIRKVNKRTPLSDVDRVSKGASSGKSSIVGGSCPASKSNKCAAGKLSDTKIGAQSKSNSRKLPRPSAKNLTIEHISEMYRDWIQQGQNFEKLARKCIGTINLNSDKLERLVHENNELAQLGYKCPT